MKKTTLFILLIGTAPFWRKPRDRRMSALHDALAESRRSERLLMAVKEYWRREAAIGYPPVVALWN